MCLYHLQAVKVIGVAKVLKLLIATNKSRFTKLMFSCWTIGIEINMMGKRKKKKKKKMKMKIHAVKRVPAILQGVKDPPVLIGAFFGPHSTTRPTPGLLVALQIAVLF
jgi:hypothetical protein